MSTIEKGDHGMIGKENVPMEQEFWNKICRTMKYILEQNL